MAMVMVMAMLMVSVIPFADMNGSDADAVQFEPYSYTIVYDSSKMATGTDALSVDGMTAIYHPSYDPTAVTDVSDGTDGYGSWTWDLETGLGPFNSFYCAFDIDHGNVMVARLNPFDLTKTIDGYDLDLTNHRYNVMWVLPTVYWKIGETTIDDTTYPTLTLTNDATAGGVAYAHTINGHVYSYVAYGVYEAYDDTITVEGESVTILTSQTNKDPTGNVSRPNFRVYAHEYEMDKNLASSQSNPAYSMLWNYYQYELYKCCCLTLMENFDAQSVVGNGKVYSGDGTVTNKTGLTDQLGPYVGTVGLISETTNDLDSSKLFIENSWGGKAEFIDGIVFDFTEVYSESTPESSYKASIYIQSNDKPTDTTDSSLDYVYKYDWSMTATGVLNYPVDIITDDPHVWGIGNVTGSTYTKGVSDIFNLTDSTGHKSVFVGGRANTSSWQYPQSGVSAFNTSVSPSFSADAISTRLAFVFDVDTTSVTSTVTFADNPDGYGYVVDENDEVVTSVAVPKGSIVSVDGDEITIGYRTFTATPSDATAQYTYDVVEVGVWSIENGAQINADTTVTANFYRTLNSYTITWVYYEDGVQTSDTTTVKYGSTPSHAKVPARDNYDFAGWDPKPVPVTGATTYTATYTPINYKLTWDPTGGTVTPKYSTGNIETAITEYPTPTRDHYTFAGWYTQPENGNAIAESVTLTANVTYYAHWTADTYTVSFDAGEGTPASASLNGSQMSPITLPSATLSGKYFAGWYTASTGGKLVGYAGTMFYPDQATTLYAKWSDTEAFVYSLNLVGNGGYDSPSALLYSTTKDGKHTFTIPMAEPKRAGLYFQGWATTSGATEAEYVAGDTIQVDPNSALTLYAVWGDEPAPTMYEWLGSVILILVVVGLLLAVVTIFFKKGSLTTTQLVASIVGIAIAVVVVVTVLAPIIGIL